MKILSILLMLLVSLSCSKDTKFAYYENIPPLQVDKRIYPLSLLETDKNIDIIMVIDNSGSMQAIQDNVVRNSKIFLQQFAKQPYINWKIGLISTDKADNPYLGFDTPFDWSQIDPRDPTSFDRTVEKFQQKVASFGTSGDSQELVFYNVKRALDLFDGSSASRPSFLRPNSHLVVIMISDEKEQSMDMGPQYDAPEYLKLMSKYVPANKVLRYYGALSRSDLPGCSNPGDNETYAGSQYEKIINMTRGFNISACITDFGSELAKVGKDIASLVGLPSLLLKERPIADTIKVYYKDKLLPSGPKEHGGVWFYEESTNTINFYTMEFVEDIRNDYFKIDFDVDDGNNRSLN